LTSAPRPAETGRRSCRRPSKRCRRCRRRPLLRCRSRRHPRRSSIYAGIALHLALDRLHLHPEPPSTARIISFVMRADSRDFAHFERHPYHQPRNLQSQPPVRLRLQLHGTAWSFAGLRKPLCTTYSSTDADVRTGAAVDRLSVGHRVRAVDQSRIDMRSQFTSSGSVRSSCITSGERERNSHGVLPRSSAWRLRTSPRASAAGRNPSPQRRRERDRWSSRRESRGERYRGFSSAFFGSLRLRVSKQFDAGAHRGPRGCRRDQCRPQAAGPELANLAYNT